MGGRGGINELFWNWVLLNLSISCHFWANYKLTEGRNNIYILHFDSYSTWLHWWFIMSSQSILIEWVDVRKVEWNGWMDGWWDIYALGPLVKLSQLLWNKEISVCFSSCPTFLMLVLTLDLILPDSGVSCLPDHIYHTCLHLIVYNFISIDLG